MTSYKNKMFHPFEISFCGYSGSGKTTLIEKLIKKLSVNYSIGYMKVDTHSFVKDREGTDTWKAKNAGAKAVAISSENEGAILHTNNETFFLNRTAFVDLDVVFIEGFKKSFMQKILVLGESEKNKQILENYKKGEFGEVIAIVGVDEKAPCVNIPYFQRNDINQISSYIESLWFRSIDKTPLYGLILGGGMSSRMGEDKGAIDYFGKSQVAHLCDMLTGVVDKVFVSCREDQKNLAHLQESNLIFDKFLGFGPTGGILSAFNEYPEVAWLVVACDMPYITKNAIVELVQLRNPFKVASCFYNENKKWAEPLFSIYEPKAAHKLGYFLINNKNCPRKMINNSEIELIKSTQQETLSNVNTPEEREQFKSQI